MAPGPRQLERVITNLTEPTPTIDLAAYERAQAARATRRRRLAIKVVAVLAAPLFAWGVVQQIRYHFVWGYLPTVEEVEREMKVWALAPHPAVLRGRPLTQHPFTSDASRVATRGSDLSLYTDGDGHVVAFTVALHRCLDDEVAAGVEKLMRAWCDRPDWLLRSEEGRAAGLAQRFADLYLSGFSILEPDTGRAAGGLPAELTETTTGTTEKRVWWWDHRRFEIEVTDMTTYDSGDQAADRPLDLARLVIVKSRAW